MGESWMFTLKEVKNELLKRYNQNIELDLLEKCIHIWEIVPAEKIAEDDGFYDESSIRKLYRGIKLKLNGYSENIISEILKKTSYKPNTDDSCDDEPLKLHKQPEITKKINTEETEKAYTYQTNPSKPSTKKASDSNVIDIASREKKQQDEIDQTIEKTAEKNEPAPKNNSQAMAKLAESIAIKVTAEVVDFLKNDEFLEKLDDLGALKRDNEILSKQVTELIKVNSMLEEKVFDLELENRSYKRIWKSFYFRTFE